MDDNQKVLDIVVMTRGSIGFDFDYTPNPDEKQIGGGAGWYVVERKAGWVRGNDTFAVTGLLGGEVYLNATLVKLLTGNSATGTYTPSRLRTVFGGKLYTFRNLAIQQDAKRYIAYERHGGNKVEARVHLRAKQIFDFLTGLVGNPIS